MNLASSGPPWSGPWFLALFPVWWCFILLILSRVGGWSGLARRYAAPGRPAGTGYYFLSGSSGGVYHKGTLILVAAPAGVYLTNLFLFRPFHPPLLLPWSGVQALEWRKYWLRTVLVLVFEEGGTKLEVFLPARAWTDIRTAAGARFAGIDRPPPLG